MNPSNPINPSNRVVLVDPGSDPRWDDFVQRHPYGWVCHLSIWKDVIEKSFKHMKGFYLALLDDSLECIRAGMPIYFIDSWLTGKRLVSIPFATICDPLISTSEEFMHLFEKAKEIFNDYRCSHIEIKSYLASERMQDSAFIKFGNYKNHVLLLEKPLNELKNSFHQMTKRNVEKSLNSGLSLTIGESELDMKAFYSLYERTRKDLELPCQPYKFFKNIREYLFTNKSARLLMVKKDNKSIAGGIFFMLKDRFAYEYAAWDRNFNNMRPNYFLLWESIKFAHANNYKLFDFGRTHVSNKGLMDFKNRWNTNVIDLLQFYYPKNESQTFSQEASSIKFKAVKKMCHILPGPLYSQLGKFIYRHLG